MSQRTLQAQDTIFGAMGRAFITVDGIREELLCAKNIGTEMTKNKVEIPVLGQTGRKHKAGGWTGTGSMTIYYSTSLFRKILLKYMNTGVDTYFDMVVENEDPSSTIGKQTIMLKRCNLDGGILAKKDIESEAMDEDVTFTFEGAEMLQSFSPVVGEYS